MFDLPGTIALTARRLGELGIADRADAVAGDFFAAVPRNGDLYLLSHVLHDWNDADCVRILRTCVRDMPAGAVLVVVDLVTAEPDEDRKDAGHRTAAMMDLYMMSLFGASGGRERTANQFRALLSAAGLETDHVDRLPSGLGIVRATRR